MFRKPVAGGESGLCVLAAFFQPVKFFPGSGKFFQSLLAFQQSGKFCRGFLTGFQKSVSFFHPLGKRLVLLPDCIQSLLLIFGKLPGGSGLLLSPLCPDQLFFPFRQLGAFLGQGHRLFPESLGVRPFLLKLWGGFFQFLPGFFCLFQGCGSFLTGSVQPGVGFYSLVQGFFLL